MRSRKRIAVLTIVVAVALSVTTVLAIKYGEFDGNRHPYVGLMVAQDDDRNPSVALFGHTHLADVVPHGRALHRGALRRTSRSGSMPMSRREAKRQLTRSLAM